jgi:hypothetical protein
MAGPLLITQQCDIDDFRATKLQGVSFLRLDSGHAARPQEKKRMKYKFLVLGATIFLLIADSTAQRKGGGNAGPPAGQSRQQGAAGQQSQMGNGAGSGMQDQQQLRLHASDQQRQQLRDCTQTADQVRNRTRDILRQSKNTGIATEQRKQWQEQLRNEIQTLNRNQEQLITGLSEEQRTISQKTIQQMETSRNRLLEVSEILGNALVAPELNQDRIQEQARATERAANELKKQQSQLAAQLNQ